MNQILSVESSKKQKTKKVRNNKPIEITSILKFFSIAILFFGIFLIGNGSYSMYQGYQLSISSTKPTIYVEQITETELRLQVTHDKSLEKVTYSWNSGEATEIDAKGKKKIEQTIEIPTGENVLNVSATDINGQEIKYQKQYELQGDISIDLELDGSNLKVTAEGKEQLSYLTYRWDEGEETRIDINDMQTEQTIEIPKGLHKLTVIVVDINNNTETKEQEVKGVTKPKLEVTTDGAANFVIKASDEEGIKRVEFIINETEKYALDLDKVLSLDERKNFEYSYPLHDGENKLEVTVYNESGVSETFRALVNK